MLVRMSAAPERPQKYLSACTDSELADYIAALETFRGQLPPSDPQGIEASEELVAVAAHMEGRLSYRREVAASRLPRVFN